MFGNRNQNPPAHVREHVDTATLVSQSRQYIAEMRESDKINLVIRMKFARNLAQVRDRMADGQWGDHLRLIELGSSSASKLVRAGRIPKATADMFRSWGEVLEHITTHSGGNTGGVTELPPAPSEIKDVPYVPPKKPAPAQREPGDDTEEIEAEKKADKALGKNGQEKYDWKKFMDKFGPAANAVDELARFAGIEKTPIKEGMIRRLDEIVKEAKAIFAKAAKTHQE